MHPWLNKPGALSAIASGWQLNGMLVRFSRSPFSVGARFFSPASAVAWICCGYGTTTPIVVLEELPSSFDAFGRSWELTRGLRGKVFGTLFVTVLISYIVPQMVVTGINSFVSAGGNTSLQTFFVVLSSLIGIVLAPILPCALTLLYYDLRVRREAFDLEILSEQLGPR